MANSRAEVHFSGTVQGVGFRYNAYLVSAKFDVAGTVQNLPDGRVQMVVEGDRTEIEAFVQEVLESTAGHVKETQIDWSTWIGDLAGFTIVR